MSKEETIKTLKGIKARIAVREMIKHKQYLHHPSKKKYKKFIPITPNENGIYSI